MNRKRVLLALPVLLLLSVGCGSNGTVTGTVSYKGTPIPTGTIMFVPDNGGPSISTAITDGKYTAEKVTPGPSKVGITSFHSEGPVNPMQKMMQSEKGRANLPPEARKAFEAGGQAKKGIKIPDEYADSAKSGLTYTVKGGKQEHNIDLK